MRRDFRSELAGVKCWDQHTEALFRESGVPLEDCVLQNREELIAFCAWIEAHRIRSFLEIGVWTGRLSTLLCRLFRFQRAAACDMLWARELGLPVRLLPEVALFAGDSHSPEFIAWRRAQGHFDLVLIDGDHSYAGVKRDFEIQRALPHRFLAFHDITGDNPTTEGVKRLWDEIDDGHKLEIVRPHVELGLARSTMGIGIWWASRGDPGHRA